MLKPEPTGSTSTGTRMGVGVAGAHLARTAAPTACADPKVVRIGLEHGRAHGCGSDDGWRARRTSRRPRGFMFGEGQERAAAM